MVTFGINMMIARLSPKSDYGVTFVSFQFYLNLTMFLATECFRKVSQRRNQDKNIDDGLLFRSAVNVSWLGTIFTFYTIIISLNFQLKYQFLFKSYVVIICLGVWLTAIIVVGCTSYWLIEIPNEGNDFSYKASMMLLSMAVFAESLAEPFLLMVHFC